MRHFCDSLRRSCIELLMGIGLAYSPDKQYLRICLWEFKFISRWER